MKLKLSDWANIADIVGAIALACSLVYVGYELHLNTIETRAANIQAMVARSQAFNLAVATNPHLTKILGTPLEELTSAQLTQIRRFLATSLREAETSYILYSKGMLDERYWRGKANEILLFLEDEGWLKQWRMGRDLFDPDFAEWLGRAIEDRYGG
jgi:hypothetical protein